MENMIYNIENQCVAIPRHLLPDDDAGKLFPKKFNFFGEKRLSGTFLLSGHNVPALFFRAHIPTLYIFATKTVAKIEWPHFAAFGLWQGGIWEISSKEMDTSMNVRMILRA